MFRSFHLACPKQLPNSLNTRSYLKRQQSFYLFLMMSAYTSTLGFGTYYFIADIPEIYIPTYSAFFLFVIFGIGSYFTHNLVTLFRLSIILASIAFYNQIFFSGGITSPALFEFIIPPLLAFFYRPVLDRYIFMVVSFLAMISFLPLHHYGVTKSLLPASFHPSHSIICATFVFAIVAIYTVLFRSAIVEKNKKLGISMKQLQETTQKLVQAEKMASLGMLSAGVAHEINNPLNFIKGSIDIIEEELKYPRNGAFKIDPYVEVMKEGLSRAVTIVNSLGHFSRNTKSIEESCDVHNILDNCTVMLQHRLKYKGKLEKDYDTKPASLLGNEGRLHQAFLNFISNAEEAIDERGLIKIQTKVLNKKIQVCISDTGVGIEKENIRKISDPFFTTKPTGQGTGLGLAITYRIIEEHGGTVDVQSTPGQGTAFTINLPRA